MNESDDRAVAPDRRDFVVVPHRPGPLVALDAGRSQRARDDLDHLIDDLFPEVEDGPGWFDALLVSVGVGLLAWTWIGELPGIVTVLGVAALALGCILPMRAAWRRARQGREHRRRQGLLERGIPIDVTSPGAAALARAYEDLLTIASDRRSELGDPAIAAAHGALLEVASLLKGRSPVSERERGYVGKRSTAIAELAEVLRDAPRGDDAASGDQLEIDPDALLAAREELDEIAPLNAVTRLEELIAEARIHRRGGT